MPPGARLYIDDVAWDSDEPPSLSPGIHLLTATLPGHQPDSRWVEVEGHGVTIDLMPKSPPQLAPLRGELKAAARGSLDIATAVRRRLALNALITCSLSLIADRYDMRCQRHDDAGLSEALISFHPGEPAAGHAKRLWDALSPLQAIEVRAPRSAVRDPGRGYAMGGWTSLVAALGAGGSALYYGLQAGALHETYRSTAQTETTALDRLRQAGWSAALISDISSAGALTLGLSAGALLYQAHRKRSSLKAFVEGN